MPKAKRARRSGGASLAATEPAASKAQLGAQKRKQLRRQRFLEKVHWTQKELEKEKVIREHGKALGAVDSLTEALEVSVKETADLDAAKKERKRQLMERRSKQVTRKKKRKKIAVAEVAQLKHVLNHTKEIANPVDLIKQHLENKLRASQNEEND